MPLPARPSRSDKTKESYTLRARDLIRRAREDMAIHVHDHLDYRRFIGWMTTHKTDWTRPTWRQYKAAVVYILELESAEGDPIAQEALELLLPIDVDGCKTSSQNTSAQKLKRLPLKDFRSLRQFLTDHKGPWHDDLNRWLSAGLLTGLRPLEWGQTRYANQKGEDVLIVKNAKHSNLRAHGPTRTILLGGLTDQERKLIKHHVDRATEWRQAEQYSRFYQGCASTLARAARRLWPKRDRYPTLYSTRHQFSADAKASGLTSAELAALMGHAVDLTAGRHYGRRSAGTDMLRVRPDPAEVAKIRLVMQRSMERHPTLDGGDLSISPRPSLTPDRE